MNKPECFTCTNCHLITSVYEAALRQGYESDWWEVGTSYTGAILYAVEVWPISQSGLVQMVSEVRSGQLALPMAA